MGDVNTSIILTNAITRLRKFDECSPADFLDWNERLVAVVVVAVVAVVVVVVVVVFITF